MTQSGHALAAKWRVSDCTAPAHNSHGYDANDSKSTFAVSSAFKW